MSQTAVQSPTARTGGVDLSLEIIVLLIFGLFMALVGLLLLPIQRGALPHAPDSTHGLFLVLLSLQAITLGKTPFGDFRRSWLLVALGAGVGVVGMVGCFIPGLPREPLRLLVGLVLTAGGLTLLLGLLVARDRARLWLRGPAPLRHLTLAAGLVYGFSLLAGLVTLFPGLPAQHHTAILLLAFGASFFYLAGSLREVRRRFPIPIPPSPSPAPASAPGGLDRAEGRSGWSQMRARLGEEAALSPAPAILFLLAILLGLLGILLFPVSRGLLPFSPDGQLGLMLVLMAIQMLALGDTPVGRFRRSGWLVAVGLGFAGAGIFACIVPGILTSSLQLLLGVLNLGGGLVLLTGQLWQRRREREKDKEREREGYKETEGEREKDKDKEKEKAPVRQSLAIDPGLAADPGSPSRVPTPPPPLARLAVTQTLLNLVGIGFGLSMLVPGMLPLPVIAGILILNGGLLTQLALILRQLDAITTPQA